MVQISAIFIGNFDDFDTTESTTSSATEGAQGRGTLRGTYGGEDDTETGDDSALHTRVVTLDVGGDTVSGGDYVSLYNPGPGDPVNPERVAGNEETVHSQAPTLSYDLGDGNGEQSGTLDANFHYGPSTNIRVTYERSDGTTYSELKEVDFVQDTNGNVFLVFDSFRHIQNDALNVDPIVSIRIPPQASATSGALVERIGTLSVTNYWKVPDGGEGAFKTVDTVTGGSGNNSHDDIDANYTDSFGNSVGPGDDVIDAGSGDDTVNAGAGDDSIYGGRGDDDLRGGAGNDVIGGGGQTSNVSFGNDILTGGAGGDTFLYAPGQGDDNITDFDGNEDFIDLSTFYSQERYDREVAAGRIDDTIIGGPLEWMRADFAADGVLDGRILQDGDMVNTDAGFAPDASNGSLTFQNITADDLTAQSTGVICFASGTELETSQGPVSVERIETGDLLLTLEDGFQPVLWIGSRRVSAANNLAIYDNQHRPIRIKAGALSAGMPRRDLLLSPQHRVLVSGKIVKRMFGEPIALAAVKHLLDVPGIEIDKQVDEVTYFHVLLDTHSVIFAEGAASESLLLGTMAVKMLTSSQKREIYTEAWSTMFHPDGSSREPQPACRFLKAREVRSLIRRSLKNDASLNEEVNLADVAWPKVRWVAE